MKNNAITNNLYTLAILLDVIGPEASLGQEAWEEISALDLSNQNGIRILLSKYVVPDYFGSPQTFQVQYLKCLQDLLSNENGELENFPMDEYPYLENTPSRLFFTILFNEISAKMSHEIDIELSK